MKILTLFTFMLLLCNSSSAIYDEEIRLIQSTITDNHISPFELCSELSWNEQFNALLEKTNGLSREEICVQLIQIISSLGDEHTMIFPNEVYLIPVRFKWVEEGAFVYVTDSINQNLLGAQLISIDNYAADSIYAHIGRLLKQDNPWYVKDMSEYFFTNSTVLYGLNIIENESRCKLKFVTQKGILDSTIIQFHPVTSTTKITWKYADFITSSLPYHQSANYWYEYIPEKNVVYFNFTRCQEIKDYPFKKFNHDLFKLIDEKKPNKLILDLRFNPGGNSRVLWPFIESIQKSYLNENAKFFVLIGKKVISSSLMNAVALKQKTKALFVGQPTSGNLIHFGEINQIALEKLKCRLIYATNKFDLMNGEQGFLNPDFTINYSQKSLLNGTDPAIEFVYNYNLPD